MTRYGKISAALIAMWFVAVGSAAALQVFKNDANRLGASVGIAATLPILVFGVWMARSKGFREFALGLSPRALTFSQTGRFMGVVFVILGAWGALPATFARSAGYGDMFIGLTAWLVAWKLATAAHRGSFIFWQGLGMLDLVTAVALGVSSGILHPEGIPMTPVTTLPLSLIPTFFVPLYFIFHVICIAQARGWRAGVVDGAHAADAAATRKLVGGDFGGRLVGS
jgi:hypothetical protein